MTNRQQKLDFIRAKCVEANESILDLKMGCRVLIWSPEYDGEDYGTIVKKIVVKDQYLACKNRYFVLIDSRSNNSLETLYFDEKEFKVVGRKPGLCDILMALNEIGIDGIPSLEEAEAFDRQYDLNVLGLCSKYNLSTDDIELQSDELVDQVFILLGGENNG